MSDPGRVYMRPGDGAFVPVVAIDTSERPDLEALFEAYTPETVGNVAIQWGLRDGAPRGTVTLFVEFRTPVSLLLILDFEIVRQSFVVDQILRTEELYLERSRTDSANAARRPRVRVVVTDTQFGPIWDDLFVTELAAQYKALGTTDRQARLMAAEALHRLRLGPH